MSNIKVENGVVVGTSGDKLTTKNPIAKYLLRKFDENFIDIIQNILPSQVIEIGCGEGHVTKILLENTSANILATDISQNIIDETAHLLTDKRLRFMAIKLEDIEPEISPDLVVCCEVLEHVSNPCLALKALYSLNAKSYVLSVPREPLFRGMNMARGAYLPDFGNSPGHLHHWSKRSFLRFLSPYFDVLQVRSPLPWTMVLCQRK